jgi:UDP-3-O-[3-hydroxymyristoyl] glucosamine N-acyltransferase
MNGFSAKELARMVGARLVGPADVTVEDVAGLEEAGPKDLAFLRGERDKEAARRSKAGVLATPSELEGFTATMLVCKDVDMAMATLLAAFAEMRHIRP